MQIDLLMQAQLRKLGSGSQGRDIARFARMFKGLFSDPRWKGCSELLELERARGAQIDLRPLRQSPTMSSSGRLPSRVRWIQVPSQTHP